MRQMAAAKRVLAEFTLKDLREHPSVPYELDEITRVIEDDLQRSPVARAAYARVSCWTVAELREFILDDATTGDEIKALSPGLTPEMVAGVAKLMSNMDLVMAGKKIRVVARCNNTIGLPGRLSSRLQPNHPRDDVDGILAAIQDGLSFGNGDAVIGINPSTDDVEMGEERSTGEPDATPPWRQPKSAATSTSDPWGDLTADIADEDWSKFGMRRPSGVAKRTERAERNRERKWISWQTRAATSQASSSHGPTGGNYSDRATGGVPPALAVGGDPSATQDIEEEVEYVREQDLRTLHVKPQVPQFTFQPAPQIVSKWAKMILLKPCMRGWTTGFAPLRPTTLRCASISTAT
jgi:hypothetical protein